MTQPILILGALIALSLASARAFGYETVYLIAYGAFALMALIIACTFLWLWYRRATPLALGMAFGWAGAASIMGWWWAFRLADKPVSMLNDPMLFNFLALYFVGALMHLQVIGRSFNLPPKAPVAILTGTVLVSVLIVALI